MHWRTLAALLGIGIGTGVQPLGAQAAQDSARANEVTQVSIAATGRLADALPPSYAGPSCMSGLTQTKVKRAVASLKAALDSGIAADARSHALQEGEQTLREAITKDKQDKNAAAWYSLGQIYLYEDNVIGADSALRRAATLAPGCRADIDDLRYTAWAPLMNGAIELSKGNSTDSALVRLRMAVVIGPDKPQAAMNAGMLFAHNGQLDSAIAYFGRAAEVAERAKMTDERNRATFNLGATLQQSNRHAEAAVALEKYIAWVPDDKNAKGALVTSYRAAGQTEKAQALEKELLVEVGVGAAPGDSGSTTRTDSVSNGTVSTATTIALAMQIGVNSYNDQKYADAAAAFNKVIAAEPNNRDAIYNLANTYYAMKENAKLIEIGTRLMALEPMNENLLLLLSKGYDNVDKDKAVKIAEQFLALPVDISAKEFAKRANEAKLTMTATGRAAQTPTGKAISPAPMVLTFDFLDASGAVVATQEAELPALKADQAHEFVLEAKGKGIVAWRYAVKK